MSSNLQPSDICSIIDSCSKSGVRVLKYQGLYLAFGHSHKNLGEIVTSGYAQVSETIPNHAAQNEVTLKHDEQEIKAEQMRMLMLENPLEYERQLRDGELDAEDKDEEEP